MGSSPSIAAALVLDDLRRIFGQRLEAFVTYAPAVSPRPSLALVSSLDLADLTACAARASRWASAGAATPVVLPRHEFARSLDAFPVEFGEILAHHETLHGDDPFVGLSVAPADLRRACEAQIRSLLPKAEERMAYGIPSYYLEGRPLVHIGAGANHCAFYPGGIVDEFAEALKGYSTSRGTIRFSPDKPLPKALVRDIVRAGLARHNARKSAQASRPAEPPAFPREVSAPARRALATLSITRLEQCARHSEAELLALHGMGPKALGAIKRALAEQGKKLARP